MLLAAIALPIEYGIPHGHGIGRVCQCASGAWANHHHGCGLVLGLLFVVKEQKPRDGYDQEGDKDDPEVSVYKLEGLLSLEPTCGRSAATARYLHDRINTVVLLAEANVRHEDNVGRLLHHAGGTTAR